MKTPGHDRYEQHFARALHYLQTHYNSDINLHHIAAAAGMSSWHWHRLYHSVMGETLHDTLKWMRLHRAAWLLCHTDRSIADIALACGYRGNAQSFTRIFRPVVMIEHREQDSQRLGNAFLRLNSLLRLRGWQDDGTMRAFSIHYPPRTAAYLPQLAKFNIKTAGTRYAALTLPLPQLAVPPLQSGVIAGGRYAVLQHYGAYADLDSASDWFLDWFRRNGLTIAAAPVILEYLDMQCCDTSPAQTRVNICVPLA